MDNTNTPKLQINQAKLTEEQRTKLETYQQAQDQLQTLSDIADMVQEVLSVLDGGSKQTNSLGAVLLDIRDRLGSLNDKEAPETPDYAKPVVGAVNDLQSALEAAIKAIDVKPQVNVDAPQVNVSPPSVDLKGVERAMAEIPQAFADAIKLIQIPEVPETDFQPLLDAWQGISEQLDSLETATRMKPQFPNTLKATNPDGSDISAFSVFRDYDSVIMTNADGNGNYQTFTYSKNNSPIFILSYTYDGNNNVTSITRT